MNFSYLAMALLSASLSDDNFTGYFLSGFIELPGGLLAVLLLLNFGRRTITAWSFLMQFFLILFLGPVFFLGNSFFCDFQNIHYFIIVWRRLIAAKKFMSVWENLTTTIQKFSAMSLVRHCLFLSYHLELVCLLKEAKCS